MHAVVPPALLSVTPLVPAGPDLVEAIRFYTDELGFAIVWEGEEMAGYGVAESSSISCRTAIVSGPRMRVRALVWTASMRSMRNTGGLQRRWVRWR